MKYFLRKYIKHAVNNTVMTIITANREYISGAFVCGGLKGVGVRVGEGV
jgi:DNA gyrase/topoisomerase IV subunit B